MEIIWGRGRGVNRGNIRGDTVERDGNVYRRVLQWLLKHAQLKRLHTEASILNTTTTPMTTPYINDSRRANRNERQLM